MGAGGCGAGVEYNPGDDKRFEGFVLGAILDAITENDCRTSAVPAKKPHQRPTNIQDLSRQGNRLPKVSYEQSAPLLSEMKCVVMNAMAATEMSQSR